MFTALLADKPLLSAAAAFVAAVAASVCNALGVGAIGAEVTAVIDAAAAAMGATYIAGEAHKAASAPPKAAPAVAPAPVAADTAAALAAALSDAAAALTARAG